MGTDQVWNVALIGIGNVGNALLGHKGFAQRGFRIVAAFDVDPEVVGRSIQSVPVFHSDEMETELAARGIRLAVLAVPAVAAQTAVDKLVAAGIEGILSFAPVTVKLPDNVPLIGVDLGNRTGTIGVRGCEQTPNFVRYVGAGWQRPFLPGGVMVTLGILVPSFKVRVLAG